MNENKFESPFQPDDASRPADENQEELKTEHNRETESSDSKERIEDNIWRPGIFDQYSDDMAAAASTKQLRDDERNVFKIFGKPERFANKFPIEEKYRTARVLRDLRNVASPEADLHHVVKTKLGNFTGNIKKIDQSFAAGLKKGNLQNMEIEKTDGMITDLPGYPLFVSASDCHPVGVYDPEHRAIGAFHTGFWEFLNRITENGIQEMIKEYGSDPSKLKVAIAPGIGSEYKMSKKDFALALKNHPDLNLEKYSHDTGDTEMIGFDLGSAIRGNLIKHGVLPENIELSEYNTAKDNDLFPSNQAEGKDARDNYGFMIGLK